MKTTPSYLGRVLRNNTLATSLREHREEDQKNRQDEEFWKNAWAQYQAELASIDREFDEKLKAIRNRPWWKVLFGIFD